MFLYKQVDIVDIIVKFSSKYENRNESSKAG